MAKAMNWNHLRGLIAVAQTGSIASAARSLGLEYSTLSRHLSALEEGVGSKLVERTPSGAALTDAGMRLLEAAETIQSIVVRAQEDIGGQDVTMSGTVRICAPEVVGAFLLSPPLARLSRLHPNLSIQLAAMPHNFSLLKREADILVAFQPPEHGRLMCRKLADYNLCAYASKAYLDEAPPIRRPADLLKHQFLNYTNDLSYSSYLDYLKLVIPDVEARFQSSSMIAQLHATLEGLGICMLPHFLAGEYPSLVPVLPEETSLARSWYLVYREDSKNLARIRVTSDYLIRELARVRPLLIEAGGGGRAVDGLSRASHGAG